MVSLIIEGFSIVFFFNFRLIHMELTMKGLCHWMNMESTVTVEEPSEILSDTQKDDLRASLAPLSVDPFSREGMLAQYTVSKTFIYQFVV